MDSYQAVYDAVRSKMSYGNIAEAIDSFLRTQDFSHQIAVVTQEFQIAASEMQRPCVLFRPSISMVGKQYCVLYGESIQNGVTGFGDSVAEAMINFDKEFNKKI